MGIGRDVAHRGAHHQIDLIAPVGWQRNTKTKLELKVTVARHRKRIVSIKDLINMYYITNALYTM